ncbi:hypothetical protein Trydic_g3248 [Trypoxylus dichotomus]
MLAFIYLITSSALIASAVEIPDVYWREYIDGHIPEDAVFVETGIYVGQLPMNGILPATIYSSQRKAVSECFTKRVEATEGVKILCTTNSERLQWKYVNIANLNKSHLGKLVRGGIEEGQILYIGKIFHEGQWKVGKVFPGFHNLRGLRIWTNSGGHHVASDFQDAEDVIMLIMGVHRMKAMTDVPLLHDNARPHTSRHTTEETVKIVWKACIIPHTADLAPLDFHLLGPLKETHHEIHFEVEEAVITCVRQ